MVVDDDGVRCVRPNGRVDTVAWAELQLVAVRTTDTGPFFEDVYIYLAGLEYGFHVTQAAQGFDELRSRLLKLPGFDGDAFIRSMSCTDNAFFVCWRALTA